MTEWDDVQKGPRWSAYILTAALMRNSVPRYTADKRRGEVQYPFDPLIPSSLQWDYDWLTDDNGSYDHGHLCPSADRRCDKESQFQTFYMSNMAPMFGPFNSGVWANIEGAVRKAASRYCDTLYVVKGGTIDAGTYGGYNLIYHKLHNGLVIPRYFYTAMFYRIRGKYYAIALWIDQFACRNSNERNLAQFAISIDQLEKRTGVDFFCNVPNAEEAKMETQCDPIAWGLR
ncbi:MAG: DNA/RNA non-specific endonuclease [Prevotella sp.]|nr:DNA/RNA non-specific endonuclease [Prevotella sp.]